MHHYLSILLCLAFFACNSSEIETRSARKAIDNRLDHWHEAAAMGDADRFFSTMAPNGVYLGTAPDERWERDRFREKYKKHFQEDGAWSFEPKERRIYFSSNGRTAWFEERLSTWMGICRGSGVLTKVDGTWRIAHYHLDKPIPNEKMDTVLTILGEHGK